MKKIMMLLVLILVGGAFLLAQEEEIEVPEEGSGGGMTFWETVKAGGLAMVFIGLCSILALGVTIERIIHMRPVKMVPEEFVDELNQLAKQGKFGEARQRCEETSNPLSNVLGAAFRTRDEGKAMTVEAVEDAGAKEMAGFQQRIGTLSIIAVISPMIGLLGTVLGMIQAFNIIAFKAGLGKPGLLAAGISKALVTTAFGLIVAVPSMVSYHFLRVMAQNIMGSIEKISERFIELIFAPPGSFDSEQQAVAVEEEAVAVEEETVAEEETVTSEEEEEKEREALAKKEEEALARKKEEEDLFQKGKGDYAKGDFKGAASWFLKVLEINPDNKDAQKYVARAKTLIEQVEKDLEA